MRHLYLALLLLGFGLLPGLWAGEEDFQMSDGRVVTGTRASEDADSVLVKVQAGRAEVAVRLAKAEIKSAAPAQGLVVATRKPIAPPPVAAPPKPAEAPRGPAEAPPPTVAAPPKSSEGAPKAPSATGDDVAAQAARVKALLVAAAEEALKEAAAPPEESDKLENPMPQQLDPTYYQLYGPLAEGVYRDNFRGAVYQRGVLLNRAPRPWWAYPGRVPFGFRGGIPNRNIAINFGDFGVNWSNDVMGWDW